MLGSAASESLLGSDASQLRLGSATPAAVPVESSLTTESEPEVPMIVGGYSPISTDPLPDQAAKADQFVRDNHPELEGAVIASAEKQVVAGINYKFIYEK